VQSLPYVAAVVLSWISSLPARPPAPAAHRALPLPERA